MIHDRSNTRRTKLQQLIRFIRRSDTAFLLIFAVITGVGAGYGAVLFRWLIHFITHAFFDGGKTVFSFLGRYYVLMIPAIGGLLVGLITHYLAPETKGHGVPEVMLAIDKQGGKIRFRVALIKAIVSSISIGSGGSVGREGPIVQIGSSLGSSMGQLFHLSKEKIRILVACGAGGGIAATFNAPLAGIFFALEVIMRDYSPRHISSIVLSSVIATVVARGYLGNNPAFDIPAYQMNSAWEILFYMTFGILAAGAAFLFIRFLYRTEDLFNILPVPQYIYPAIGGLMVGTIGLWYPQVFGVGYETIELALNGNVTTVLALVLLFVKLAATSLTLGSGGSGGVFAPSLFIGAMLGVAFSKLTLILFPGAGIEPGANALIGMAAVFAAAANAPISAILFLFELTGDYKIILPLMAAVIMAYLAIRGLSSESIYTLKLVRRGHRIQSRKHSDILEHIIVDEAMSRNVTTVDQEQLVEEAGLMIKNTGHRGFPVVDQNNKLCGIITRKDINKALAEGLGKHPIIEVMSKDVITCKPDENLRQVLETLGTRNIGRSPVVDPKYPGTIVGIITRKNIISAIHDVIGK